MDKHDDMATPEDEFPPSCSSSHAGINNHNFLTAAAVCRQARRVLWILPDFECNHCDYRGFTSSGMHECEVGRLQSRRPQEAGGAVYAVRPLDPALRDERKACGSQSSEWATMSESLSPSRAFTYAAMRVSQLATVLSCEGLHCVSNASLLKSWFRPSSSSWALDLDLDYFVDDLEAPKMCGPPDHPFDHEGVADRFDSQRLVHMREGLGARGPGVRGSEMPPLELLAEYDLYSAKRPSRSLDESRIASRINALERVLRSLAPPSKPPRVITVVRSNIGGYTPVEATAHLESAVLQMLRRLWPDIASAIYGEGTLNATDTAQLGVLLAGARTQRF